MSLTRLVYTAGLVVFFAHFFTNSTDAKKSPQCPYPSSCGDLHNIKHPFRFKGFPENCGKKKYELECENNRTVVHLFSGKYNVLAINYNNYTIRLVDVGIQVGNCSSLPLYSLSPGNLPANRPENFVHPYSSSYESHSDYFKIPEGVCGLCVAVWVDCEKAVESNLLYKDPNTTCIKQPTTPSSSLSTGRRHSYLVFGSSKLTVRDVEEGCRIDHIIGTNTLCSPGISFLDIHNQLAYGFELYWVYALCEDCRGQGPFCHIENNYTANCFRFCAGVRKPNSFLCTMEAFYYSSVRPGLKITGWSLVGRTSLGILCLFAFLIYKFRRRHLSMFDTIEGFLQSQNNLMPIRYSYSDIKKMTKGFNHKLGEGGYGTVYKGTLRSGFASAIKVLGKSKANGQEFINEVATIGRIHHVNVVRLIGFCVTRSKHALVYEFMPKGSLEKYIFSQGNTSLSCMQMYEISLGVARGIDYLHRGCDMQILHFDIKPHNILLDENFNPKISDFGLAKLYPIDNSIVSLTAARGTMGYMAPELFYKNIGRVSYKADVYSFGMLLMEMAGRRRNLNLDALADHPSQIYFPSWIYDQFKEGKEIEMVEATEEERQLVKKMVIIALWCIQMNPSDRPSMNKVVEMLEGNVEVLEMPPKPFLTPQEMTADVK